MNKFKIIFSNKKFLISFIFFIYAILTEIITFIYLGFGLFPKYISLDISIILIISCFTFLIPSYKVQIVTTTFIMIFQLFLSYVNITLNNIFGTIMTFDMLNLISEAGKAVEKSVIGFNMLVFFIIWIIMYLFINYYVLKRFGTDEQTTFNLNKFILRTMSILLIITASTIFYKTQIPRVSAGDDEFNEKIIGNDAYLYDSLLFKSEALKKFGTYSLYLKDFENTFSKNDTSSIEYEDSLKFIEEGEMSKKGQYTGISKGNNVIVILTESLEWAGIDPELTPTLYDLSHNHVSMTNYYSKSKTNYSEAIGILGSYPLDQSIASVLPNAIDITNNNFDFSLPNMLKINGYGNSSFLINHDKYFYSRNLSHYNFGFDELYDISDFDIKDSTIEYWGDWVLDSEFFEAAKDVIAPEDTDEPFFTWISSMIMHGPYEGNYRLEPYFDALDSSDWVNPLAGTDDEEHMRHYMAAAMDLDAALAFLFNDLEAKGILDKTTVVLFSDHNAYYYDIGAKLKGLDGSIYSNPEIYRIPFMIYDQNLPAMQIDHFTNPYDIVTSTFDLLGIEYNQNLYLGTSVFMPEESSGCFVSLTGGIFNENIYTNNGMDYIVVGDNIDDEQIEEFSVKVNNTMTKAMHINNLYKYDLLNKIKSLQEE